VGHGVTARHGGGDGDAPWRPGNGATVATAASQLRRLLRWSSAVTVQPCNTEEGRRGEAHEKKTRDGWGATLTREVEVATVFGYKTGEEVVLWQDTHSGMENRPRQSDFER
jgi:hypothetical protein